MSSKKNPSFLIIAFLIGIFVIMILAFLFLKKSNSDISKKVKNVVGMSIASVDGNKISFSDLETRTLASKSFFENQNFEKKGIRIDFNTPDGQKRLKILRKMALNNLIEGKVLENIAKRNNITVTEPEVSMALKRAIDSSDPEFAQKRIKLYNFTEEEFAKNVVYRELLLKKVEQWYKENNKQTNEEKKNKIESIRNKLNSGMDFSEVAQKFSEGLTAKNGGKLGFFQYNQLEPEVAKKAFSMNKGEISDIIESNIGFHIIKIDDLLNNDSNKKTMVSISQILIKKKSFIQFFEESVKRMKINIDSPDFKWDSEKNSVVFKDPSMQKFEDNVEKEDIEKEEQ